MCMVFPHQWYYDLAIGVCLEVVWVLESFADDSVVIDFAIDGKGNAFVAVGEWLSSRVNTNNGQTLMGKHCGRLENAPPKQNYVRIPVLLAI
jgi:hypothetical protein